MKLGLIKNFYEAYYDIAGLMETDEDMDKLRILSKCFDEAWLTHD